MASIENVRTRAPRVVMCLDGEASLRPETVGLAGEALSAQPWLKVMSSGVGARDYLRRLDASSEAWVVSSDDVDPINLAAAIKRDSRERRVSLVAFEGTGSLRSRASSAGIDAVLGLSELAARYRDAKRSAALPDVGGGPARTGVVDVPAPSVRTGVIADTPFGREAATARDAVRNEPRILSVADPRESADRSALPRREGSSVARVAAVPGKSAFVMPVVSASGGSGKSTVSVLASLISQEIGYRTVLVDLDLQFGDVLALAGRDDALRVDEAIESPSLLARFDQERSSMPAIIGAPRRLERAETIAADVPQLLDALRGSFDVVIANTGSLWGEQHAAVLEQSSKALFLIDQRPSSLRACQHALELCARCGIATSPFLFAANRCGRGALYTSIDVSCALRGAQAVELAEGGPDVEDALAAGQPGELVEDRNDLCESIRDVLEGVLPGCAERLAAAEAASPRPRRLFGRRRARGRAACL